MTLSCTDVAKLVMDELQICDEGADRVGEGEDLGMSSTEHRTWNMVHCVFFFKLVYGAPKLIRCTTKCAFKHYLKN